MDCKSIIEKHKIQFSIVKYCKYVTIHSCLTALYSEARLAAWNNEQARDGLITTNRYNLMCIMDTLAAFHEGMKILYVEEFEF